jgi:hypothetical protein
MPLSPEIRVLRTREQLKSLRDFWQSCQPCRDADFDFFLFFIDLSLEAQRPHVTVIYEAGIPTAILAGRLDVTRIVRTTSGQYWLLPSESLRQPVSVRRHLSPDR